jgi:hypothetical protein
MSYTVNGSNNDWNVSDCNAQSLLQRQNCGLYSADTEVIYHRHCHQHSEGLALETCSFKAQGVLGLAIFD